MSFRLRTPCKEFSYSLNEVEKLLDNPEFDINKKLAIYVAGWTTSTDSSYVTDMAEAFTCRGDHNYLVS